MRIESEAFGANLEHLQQLNASSGTDEIRGIVDAVERVFAAGNYVIFRHNRIVGENVHLPEWLDDVVKGLSSATRPKIFIVSQLPVFGDRLARCSTSLQAQRVPTVDEYRLTEFCYQLIGHFDEHPQRWEEEEVQAVVRASGGNIGFLVSLIRAASGIEDFDQLDHLIVAGTNNMAASITAYVRWAFSELRGFEDEQRLLLFLNDVSPCDIIDLERAVAPKRPLLRVLGKLLDLGLIERESENLYRLTPLLANRLSRDLIRPDLINWLRDAMVNFVKTPLEVEVEDHAYIRIESRIQASILADKDELPNSVAGFVSASHLFQAGISRIPSFELTRL